MKLSELITACRLTANDTQKPYLWSDDFIAMVLNEAEQEAAVRAKLLRDNGTPAVCEIVLRAGQSVYRLHPSIEDISAMYAPDGSVMGLIGTAHPNYGQMPFLTDTGTPFCYRYDSLESIRVYPVPNADGEKIRLSVSRLPLRDMVADTDRPELPVQHHRNLTLWALHKMYAVPDADTYSDSKSAMYLTQFEKAFGKRISADVRETQRMTGPVICRSKGLR